MQLKKPVSSCAALTINDFLGKEVEDPRIL